MPGAGAGTRFGGTSRGRRAAAAIGLLAAVSVGGAPRRAAAGPAPFWERAAEPPQGRCDRLLAEAESLLGSPTPAAPAGRPPSPPLARAEALVQEALAIRPDDFRGLSLLAELEARAGRRAQAVATLERACAHAPRGHELTGCWFRVGVERSRAGQLAPALAAYERLIALGAADAPTYGNAAELLMALGRLGEAEERYREAIRLESPSGSGRLENPTGLTFNTYGLAVALDRAGRAGPAREMIARALALDPRLLRLRAAEQPGGEVFFLPEGDVYYYIGLASEAVGRTDDAEAAFQEFLGRLPRSPFAGRARAHLAELQRNARAAASGHAPASGAPAALHVVAAGTTFASGPIPAPLVDAAWRARPPPIDDCLEQAVRAGTLAPRESFRLAIELEIDGRGAVTQANVKAVDALDATFARCVEHAVRTGLSVPRPQRARPTRARIELLLASGDAGGV